MLHNIVNARVRDYGERRLASVLLGCEVGRVDGLVNFYHCFRAAKLCVVSLVEFGCGCVLL